MALERILIDRVPWDLAREHLARYMFACLFVCGRRVLDVACGTGYGSEIMRVMGGDVIGVDISREAIETAKRSYPRIQYIICDACCLPFRDDAFDVSVSFETIEHLPDPETFLREVVRTTRETLVISTPDHRMYNVDNPYHVRELTRLEFESMLRRLFKQVTLYYQSQGGVYMVAVCRRPRK